MGDAEGVRYAVDGPVARVTIDREARRNALSWDEKFEFDNWYEDHLSFWHDIKILARTVGSVLKPNNISADGHATMPEFGLHENLPADGSIRTRT